MQVFRKKQPLKGLSASQVYACLKVPLKIISHIEKHKEQRDGVLGESDKRALASK